jgi:hypothetical protein
MLFAVRLVDLGTLITMGVLEVALGVVVFVLYRWLLQGGEFRATALGGTAPVAEPSPVPVVNSSATTAISATSPGSPDSHQAA